MPSTNKTTNLQLSQFTQTDTPKWLQDYNADMSKTDEHAGKTASDLQYGHYRWGDDATKFNNPTGTSAQLLNGQGVPITPTATPVSGSNIPFTAGGAFAALASKMDSAKINSSVFSPGFYYEQSGFGTAIITNTDTASGATIYISSKNGNAYTVIYVGEVAFVSFTNNMIRISVLKLSGSVYTTQSANGGIAFGTNGIAYGMYHIINI